MSYDIGLYRKGLKNNKKDFYYDYDGNITYNVYEMLEVAFGKNHLKKWNNLSCNKFIKDLEKGYLDMKKNPKKYKKYDSPNGWGTYETTLYSIEKLYKKIKEYAEIDGLENIYLEFI